MEAPKRDQIPCAQKYSLVVRENNGATVYMYPAVQGNFGLVCEFLQRIQYPGVELFPHPHPRIEFTDYQSDQGNVKPHDIVVKHASKLVDFSDLLESRILALDETLNKPNKSERSIPKEPLLALEKEWLNLDKNICDLSDEMYMLRRSLTETGP
ncbi:MAG: hypothetical protein LQ350_004219 [Teloschistes chrysophthalmus]|nr:MAG: hypothetical protein LQ350_004219 [Niorma chrysophthalma]